MSQSDDISSYIQKKIENMALHWKDLQYKISKHMLISKIMLSLPPSYKLQ